MGSLLSASLPPCSCLAFWNYIGSANGLRSKMSTHRLMRTSTCSRATKMRRWFSAKTSINRRAILPLGHHHPGLERMPSLAFVLLGTESREDQFGGYVMLG